MSEYKIVYNGSMMSLNDLYSGKHWSSRHKAKIKYRDIFDILLLQAKVKWMDEYRIEMTYNSRLDSDNTITAIKFLNDSLKKKYVPEDDPRYFKGFSVDVDKKLKFNTYVFNIIQLK